MRHRKSASWLQTCPKCTALPSWAANPHRRPACLPLPSHPACPSLQVTHARCFWSWGGTFVVHPRLFLVHVPHERSPTYHATYANNWQEGSKV